MNQPCYDTSWQNKYSFKSIWRKKLFETYVQFFIYFFILVGFIVYFKIDWSVELY